jgi:hypothetical protein
MAHNLPSPSEGTGCIAVQPIYYLGFTIAGMSEPLGVIATLLLVFTPRGNGNFWLTLVAFLGRLGMQAVEPFLAAGRATA